MSVDQLSDAELFAIAGIQPQGQAAPARDMSQPRNMRNNNPGNIEDGPYARSLPGYVGSDGRFAIFDDPQAGTDAKLRLLRSYGQRGFDTPREIIGRWAPASDGNDVDGYASFVSQRLGVNPDDPLNMMDDATLQTLAGAIQEFEGGPAMGGPAPQADLSGMSDEELMRLAGIQAPMVDEITLQAARPGERERIFVAGRPELGELQSERRDLQVFQPVRDFMRPVGSAFGELGRDLADYGDARGLSGIGKMGEILLDVLMLPAAAAQGVLNQATGPAGRALANAEVPIYGGGTMTEAPQRLEGQAAADAFQGAFDTAASGARAVPRMGPPRPTVAPPTRVERRVGSALNRAVTRDQMNPQQVIDTLRADPELPAFQAGGENMRAMADVLAQTPGEANVMVREAAMRSQATATDRVLDQAERALGGQGDYFATLDRLAETRAAEAGQGMAQIGQSPVQLDQNAIQALRAERARGAIKERALNAQASPDPVERASGERLFTLADDLATNPNAVNLTIRDAQDISYYLREQASAAYASGDGGRGKALKTLAAAVRDSAKRSSPEYEQWLKRYGDNSDNMEALELGRDVFMNSRKMNAEGLRSTLDEMSPASLDFFRKGVGEAVVAEARATKGGVGAARQLMRSREFSDRVRLAFPNQQSFDDFMRALEREVRVQEKNTSVAGGSPTAYRQAARADLEQQGLGATDVVSGVADMVAGIPPRAMTAKAIRNAAQALPRRDRSLVGDPATNAALGRALSDPAELERLLTLMEIQNASRARRGANVVKALPPLLTLPAPEGPRTSR